MTKSLPMPELYHCEKLKANITLMSCEANRQKPSMSRGYDLNPNSKKPKAPRPHACENCEDWKAWGKSASPQKEKNYSEQRVEKMELEQVKRDNANLRVVNRQLEDKIASHAAENVSLAEHIQMLEKDVLDMTKHYNTACKMLDGYRQDIKELENINGSLDKLNAEYVKKIQELEKDVLQLSNLNDCTGTMMGDNLKNIENLEEEITKLTKERDAALELWHDVFENSPSYLGVVEELKYARQKHPSFAKDLNHAVVILLEETGEVAKAVYEENPAQARKELCQVGCVVVRFLEETELCGYDKDN